MGIWITIDRQILCFSLSKPSFRAAPKGTHDVKGPLAYDFERIVWLPLLELTLFSEEFQDRRRGL